MRYNKIRPAEMIGKTFNCLTVLSYSRDDEQGQGLYICSCICGNTTERVGRNLRNSSIRSCGCGSDLGDLTGKKFHHLKVIRKLDRDIRFERYRVRCDCKVEFEVVGSKLRDDKIRSCGCKRSRLMDIRSAELDLINFSNITQIVRDKVAGFIVKAIRSNHYNDVLKVNVPNIKPAKLARIERGEYSPTKVEEDRILAFFGVSNKVFESNLKKYSKIVRTKVEETGMECDMTIEDLIDRILHNLVSNNPNA